MDNNSDIRNRQATRDIAVAVPKEKVALEIKKGQGKKKTDCIL